MVGGGLSAAYTNGAGVLPSIVAGKTYSSALNGSPPQVINTSQPKVSSYYQLTTGGTTVLGADLSPLLQVVVVNRHQRHALLPM